MVHRNRAVATGDGRRSRGVNAPIWLGLGGLTLSGVVLAPDTSAPLTVVKLVAATTVGFLNAQQ